MTVYSVPLLLATVLFAILGIYLYVKRRGSPGTRAYAIWCYFTVHWHFCWGLLFATHDPVAAVQLARIGYSGVIFLPIAFYHFVVAFLKGNSENNKLVAIYAVGVLFAASVWVDSLFIVGCWSRFWGFFPRVGPLHPVYLCFLTLLIVHGLYLLFSELRRNDITQLRRTQVKYVTWACVVYIAACVDFLPNYGVNLYPFGYLFTLASMAVIVYGITKHQVLDIKVIVRKTAVYALILVLGIAAYVAFVAHFTHRRPLPLANFSIATAAFSLLMGIWVVWRAPKRKLTFCWGAMCVSVALWSFGFGMMTRAVTSQQSLFWQTWFLYGGATFIPAIFLHFVFLLTHIKMPKIVMLAYGVAIVLQVLNLSGHLATAMPKPPFLYYTEGIYPIYHLYTAYFFAVSAAAHWILFCKLRTATGQFRNQIQYVFIGTGVGFLGGATTFALVFNVPLFPIGTYLVPFYLVSVTYAIYRHHLMDIHVVLRKSVVYSLMTAIITAIYLVAITQGAHILQQLFGVSTISVSVIAACFITAIFLPLRSKVQAFVDRYFFSNWEDREVVRQVAAGFSHELKSPLAGLSMQAQLALAELMEVEEGRRAWIEALPKIKHELQHLINKTMDVARRIEAVRGVAEPAAGQIGPVEVGAVLDSGLTSFESRLCQMDLSVRKELPVGLPLVCSNEKQLEIVFINLIKNALDAMEGKNSPNVLLLAGVEQEDFVLVSIKDTGSGIASKDIARIFEPYFTTKGHWGTGMGLYLTQQIVKAHRGSIEVRSQEGHGTEFLIRLPKYIEKSGSNRAA